ncbi:hypothetical protein [Treponema sp.]|nr:hypothetical protein [Treponema sp.]
MAKMDYVEPDSYLSPSMRKILKAGESKAKSTGKSKPAPKKSVKK